MFLSVCVVVFVLLMFIIPRLKRMARFATFDGTTSRLNLMGTSAASIIAASLVSLSSLVYPNPA